MSEKRTGIRLVSAMSHYLAFLQLAMPRLAHHVLYNLSAGMMAFQ